ncbi:MAG: hypothetical protein JSR40_05300 [Proteobacteria bacterium]|nr:hypothetical protein [Pseudomonadota bacterium]
MSDQVWVQFLLVGVPVLSLIGSWLALRAVGRLHERRGGAADQPRDRPGGAGRDAYRH